MIIVTGAAQGAECRDGVSSEDQYGCAITWVEHNQKHRLIYQRQREDFIVDMSTGADGTIHIGSSTLPTLEDVDRDGWVDLTAFALIGMVNGDLYAFRKAPTLGQFVELGTMNGGDSTRMIAASGWQMDVRIVASGI